MAWVAVVAGVVSGTAARAQEAATLPGLPRAQAGQAAAVTVRGGVVDASGAAVPGARVTLVVGAAAAREAVSGPDGQFVMEGVPAGAGKLSVVAGGFNETTENVTVQANAGEADATLDPVVLQVGTAISVTAMGVEEIALAEVHAEEQQRLFGILPNFYVVYDRHAEPLSPRLKMQLAWKTITDPANLVLNAGFAGFQQATNEFSGYGQGAAGYGKRYGAITADTTIGAFLGGGVLPILFRQDPRYFYKGTGSVPERAAYAFSTAFVCKGDNGKWQPSYSGMLGDFGSAAISNLYYPASDRHGARLTLENGALSILSDGAANVVQEFLLKHLTSRSHNHGADLE